MSTSPTLAALLTLTLLPHGIHDSREMGGNCLDAYESLWDFDVETETLEAQRFELASHATDNQAAVREG